MLKTDKGTLVLKVKPFSLKFKNKRYKKNDVLGFYKIFNEDMSIKGFQTICDPSSSQYKLFSEKELENHIRNGWFTIGKYEDFWV